MAPLKKFPLLILAGLVLFAAVLEGQEKKRPPTQLKPGQTASGTVRFDKGSSLYEISVPETAFAIKLALSQASTDLDLVLKYKDETVASRETGSRNEELVYSRLSEPPLKPGKYTVEVKYPFSFPPLLKGRVTTQATFKLSYSINAPTTLPLAPGVTKTAELKAGGKTQGFVIEVPSGVLYLRFDLHDSIADLDLWAARKELPLEAQAAEYRSESTRTRETILIGDGKKPIEPGKYYILVFEPSQKDQTDAFSLTASFSKDAPAFLLAYPLLPEPKSPLDLALRATVEIHAEDAGGSGCLLSPAGYVITNLHVLGGIGSPNDEKPVIALNLRDDLPPLELFRAEVVRTDEKRDLALLKIVSGLYGQPLPPKYRFPAFPLGDVKSLAIGDPLGFFGYPTIGGTGSRVTMTYTRGVVSGFEKTGASFYIKTDGEINEGNSGGAAVNQRWELIGLPTQIVGIAGGQIGYITPVTAIPEDWLSLLKGEAPKQ